MEQEFEFLKSEILQNLKTRIAGLFTSESESESLDKRAMRIEGIRAYLDEMAQLLGGPGILQEFRQKLYLWAKQSYKSKKLKQVLSVLHIIFPPVS